MMKPDANNLTAAHAQTRRHFFEECGLGLGKIALAGLLSQSMANSRVEAASSSLAAIDPPLTARAKRVVFLFMAGAPSQLDLFDYKPKLAELEGKPLPPSVLGDQRYAFIRPDAALMGPRYKFSRHGQSGAELSEMLPHLAEIADDIAVVKSMKTDQFNHAPAQIFMNTGSPLPGRPSMGSWVVYGLGTASEDLPAFVVLSSGMGSSGGAANWSNGFLPGAYAGVPFRSSGDPILFVSNPRGVDQESQRQSIDLVATLNQRRLREVRDPAIETRIAAYETAFRMQTSAPELVDLSGESPSTLEMYGATPGKASFANNCLMARRLLERGVRFVNVYHSNWDHHSDVAGGLKTECGVTDQASAALVKDLKARGMLEDTLVVWGGEFGRTPMVESGAALNRSMGRDHHPQAFTMWLAGGGIRSGITLGSTDEFGFHVVEDPVHVHDLQATILHQLGLDHERLTFTYQGRPFRLTDVHGSVVKKLIV